VPFVLRKGSIAFSADFQEHHPFEAILGVLNQLNALKRYLYFCNGGKVLD